MNGTKSSSESVSVNGFFLLSSFDPVLQFLLNHSTGSKLIAKKIVSTKTLQDPNHFVNPVSEFKALTFPLERLDIFFMSCQLMNFERVTVSEGNFATSAALKT